MGNRKERRLAAKNNAGRRVKLDLFAEPSNGDLGGSSVQDEVEVDKESKHRAGLPNSPSASGQPENPLLLLGQYSDDDLEVESDKKTDDISIGEASSPGNKDEAEVSKVEGRLDVEVIGDEVKQHEIDKGIASLDVHQNLEDTNTRNDDATGSGDVYAGQVSSSGASELNGDVGSSWQMVMHEESNQCYYWNVTTGETSWEIPEALAQKAELSDNHKTATSETAYNIFPDSQEPNLSSGEMLDNPSAAAITIEGLNPVEWNGGGTSEGQHDGSIDASLDDNPTKSCSEKLVDSRVGTEDASRIDLSSNLVKHCESLLERLESVNRSKNQSPDCISKYTLEVEIRLSDIKMLSAFGSSLHHFWAHSEKQLKRLEDSINFEIYKLAQSAVLDDTFQESSEPEPEANGTGRNRDSSPCLENAHVSPAIDTSTVIPKDENDVIPCEQENGDLSPDEDDVDMDVDMEVEDASSDDVTESGAKEFTQPLQEMHNPPLPPPDDEWIPPPPPDNEQIPPPLPAEPPEPVYIEPSVPYTDQYNMSYPNGNFAYYGQASSDVASNNFYGQVEGCQITVPQAPVYYTTIPSTHLETPHIAHAPVAYYEFQDAVPPAPGVSGTVTSQFQAEPALITYGSLVSDGTGSAIPTVEAGYTSAHDRNSGVSGGTNRTSSEVLPPTTTIETPAVVSSVPTTNPVSGISATSAVPKGQTKVVRSKKRALAVAPTSRSSKKVSSLVNKWKAAKEELLEAEEEPQTAYEMLERKRQKEIEEWCAQQIASGEAKDNANFQPLGGDWRERVKRRRAQQASKAAQTPPEEHNDENQRPDLTKLSKDLPSGWQVYWDESSKQLYYGNVITSETTWTRPTK